MPSAKKQRHNKAVSRKSRFKSSQLPYDITRFRGDVPVEMEGAWVVFEVFQMLKRRPCLGSGQRIFEV